MEKFGPTIELSAIEASWGDTLTDEEMIAWLEEFVSHGSAFEHDIEADDLDEVEAEFQKGITRH